VRDTLGNVVQYNPQTFTLTGELSNAMNSFEVHIAGTMPNADTFMPIQTPNVPEENGTNFREISDIIISFTANLDGLPPASFSITGNRTDYDGGNGTMTIAYGGRSIEATANFVNGDATGSISITNQDGVVATIERNNTSNNGEIIYDGQVYATIETVNGIAMIRYIDGYFEVM
jgi:hypothetical protein